MVSGWRSAQIAALALANLHVPGRPATLCPFRAVTGLPCPFCGGTTAAVRLGRFDVLGALRANPVVVLGAVLVADGASGTKFAVRSARRLVACTVSEDHQGGDCRCVVFSEVWQLFRFGIL